MEIEELSHADSIQSTSTTGPHKNEAFEGTPGSCRRNRRFHDDHRRTFLTGIVKSKQFRPRSIIKKLEERVKEKEDQIVNGRRVLKWTLFVPILQVCLLFCTLIGCYAIAYNQKDIPRFPYLAYISEIADKRPQSSLFTLGLIGNSFMNLFSVMLRYKQVLMVSESITNRFALVCGVLMCMSKFVVASFQLSDTPEIHHTAAACFLPLSFVYCVCHVFLTHKTLRFSTKSVFAARIVLVDLMLASAMIFGVFQFDELSQYNDPPTNIAQCSQWIYLVLFNLFSLTFVQDFKILDFNFEVNVSREKKEDDELTATPEKHISNARAVLFQGRQSAELDPDIFMNLV